MFVDPAGGRGFRADAGGSQPGPALRVPKVVAQEDPRRCLFYTFGERVCWQAMWEDSSSPSCMHARCMGGPASTFSWLIALAARVQKVVNTVFDQGCFGDLYFSGIKRYLGIKDYSRVLSSHGPLADRHRPFAGSPSRELERWAPRSDRLLHLFSERADLEGPEQQEEPFPPLQAAILGSHPA